ncbi:hypothetical protein VNO78_04726 [Psophocarpus tetragonolobus]|uniref:C2 domain-containing protein n=1 Tax=Psophocarpus tetragonolobus TaxID=3891 RepID=A0AAN9T3C1_PSOTE
MEYRTLELKIISAKEIKNVNMFSKMDVYAVVSLYGDPHNPQGATTQVHKDAGTNPTWNYSIKFAVNEWMAKENRVSLEIKLISDRTLGDTVIGTVHVPLRELLDNPAHDASFRQVSYQVIKTSGKPKGSLNFSFRFGEHLVTPSAKAPPPPPPPPPHHDPVMAYPPSSAASSASSSIPQPPSAYGYPYAYPPHHPYSAYQQPPQSYAYCYPPQQPQQPKKNKFGLGLGAGLLGGAFGGMLLGDMISDAGAYHAGFDAAFDDSAAFDF